MMQLLIVSFLHTAPVDAPMLTRPASQQLALTADEAVAVSLTVPLVRQELAKSGGSARPLAGYFVTAAPEEGAWRVTWAINDANARDGAFRFRVDLNRGAVAREKDVSGLLTRFRRPVVEKDADSPRRACADGLSVVAEDLGRAPNPVSRAEVLSIAERKLSSHGLPVLTPADARQLPGNPQLVITQHVATYKTEVFFVVRAALTESGTDASGRAAQVVVWQGEPASGVTSPESAKEILMARIEEVAGRALNECR